jgi:uncharacterized membrane protein YccC
MQIQRRWHSLIVLAALYAVFLTAMILTAVWKWHDTTNLLLHLSLLTNLCLVVGLLFWFGERRKYFRTAAFVVVMIGCVILAIHQWQQRNPWGYIFYTIWFLWGLYSLKEEIVKHMTIDHPQETNDQLLPGPEK